MEKLAKSAWDSLPKKKKQPQAEDHIPSLSPTRAQTQIVCNQPQYLKQSGTNT